MDELNYNIMYLKNFLADASFFDELLPRYNDEIACIGSILRDGTRSICVRLNEDTEELIDYLDGNNFIVKRNRHYILLEPCYPPPSIDIIKPDEISFSSIDEGYWAPEDALNPKIYEGIQENLKKMAKCLEELNTDNIRPPPKRS